MSLQIHNLLNGQAGTIPTYVPIIYVLLHRLGVIAGNHFNGPYRLTEGGHLSLEICKSNAFVDRDVSKQKHSILKIKAIMVSPIKLGAIS